jgi:acetate kinase
MPGGTTRHVLCLNSGSSSIKAAVYEVVVDDAGTVRRETRVDQVLVEHLAPEPGEDPNGSAADARHAAAVDQVLAGLHAPIDAVGHRLVHGGPALVEHRRIDAEVLRQLRAAVVFAPLHLPAELGAIDAVTARHPRWPQVACLDTAFHRDLPEVATRFALPQWVADRGVRRFGFHGLSYEYVVSSVGAETLGRAVIAHLGSGASLVAVDHGRPLDTTMGLTPTGGIVMGTRPGDLDPGAVMFLAREPGMSLDVLGELLDRESGLLGLSGTTSEVRDLLAVRDRDERARLALAVFTRSVAKAIGSYAVVLGGIDTVVFTGGVGEHAAAVRTEICAPLAHLGITLDPAANESVTDGPIAAGAVRVLVVPTNEELMIARHTAALTHT